MKTTTKLAIANLKVNKSRMVLICISIILTTMLLTIIGLSGYGLVKENKVNAGKRNGEHYGAYVNVSEEIYNKIKIHADFYEIGRMESFAGVSLEDADGIMAFMDETTRGLSNFHAEEGSFPKNENEIIAQKEFFQLLGYPKAEIGDKVTVTYRVLENPEVTNDFIISGFTASNEINDSRGIYGAYVSQTFYEKAVPKSQRSYSVCFKVKGEDTLNYDQMKEKIIDLGNTFGIDKAKVVINSAYLMWALDPGTETISICIIIASMVVLFSALVIYNIFYVGIIQKVREYGKLRAVGTTKRQIKNILLKEGMILTSIGVAFGLLAGSLFSNLFFKWLLKRMYESFAVGEMEKVSVMNIPILLLVALISFVSVYFSLLKPMKIGAAVSPVEAMRYQEGSRKDRSKRKGYNSVNVFRLTMSNLARNKKRTFTTIMTMGLSCVMFVVVANVAGNMDAEYDARNYVKTGDFYISLDTSYHDEVYPENNLNHVQQQNLMNKEWLQSITEIDGVTQLETAQKILVKRENMKGELGEPYSSVNVFSKEDYELQEIKRGHMDYDSALKNHEIIFGSDYWMDTYGYAIGDEVSLTFYDGDKEVSMTFILAGSIDNIRGGSFIITDEQMEAMKLNENMTADVWISCEKGKENTVQSELEKLIASSQYYVMETYADAYKRSNMAIHLMKGALYALLGIIGIIGFMNMANTLITSIITRRRELGILQAIGLTKAQLNKMLQMEGLVFTLGTLLVSLTLGNGFGYLAFLKCKTGSVIGIHNYGFPRIEMIVMVSVLLLLQMILSYYMSVYLQKDALIDRIRYQD